MNRLALVWCAVFLSACFDFDKAYQNYCDGGRCNPVSTGGGSSGGGTVVAGGGSMSTGGGLVSTGGGVSSGGGTSAGGGTAAGGSAAGGLAAGGGSVSSGGGVAGCSPWGSTCTGEGECCDKSDAGLSMACARNNYCLEVPDCRGGMTSCATNDQCCSNRCDADAGRCTSRSTSEACITGADCIEGYMCLAGTCTSANSTVGAFCNTSDSCRESTNWCDMADAGPHNGVCVSPVANSCTVLNSSLSNTCCEGLVNVSGVGCRLSLGSWCYYSSACASNNCVGDRCTAQDTVPLGSRCNYGNDCKNPSTYCDPATLTCVTRICIPPQLNIGVFSGCCTVSYPGNIGICRFADAGSCLIGGELSVGNPGACCSGSISVSNRCTGVVLFQ
jgi:hypothetical protein